MLAKIRASVVSEPTLAEAADDIGLGDALLLGRGELLSGGRSKPSILADAFEAVIGAVYIDGGYEAAARVVVRLARGRRSTRRRSGRGATTTRPACKN